MIVKFILRIISVSLLIVLLIVGGSIQMILTMIYNIYAILYDKYLSRYYIRDKSLDQMLAPIIDECHIKEYHSIKYYLTDDRNLKYLMQYMPFIIDTYKFVDIDGDKQLQIKLNDGRSIHSSLPEFGGRCIKFNHFHLINDGK